MKAMLAAFVAIAVIGLASHYGLQEIGFSTQERNVSSNVRLD